MPEFDNKSIQEAIAKIKKQYSNVSGDILNQAISRAINRAAEASRTISNSEIRKKYNISRADIAKEFTIKKSNKNRLTAELIAKGSPLSLTKFQAKQEKPQGTTSFNRKGVASSRLNRKSRSNAVKGVTAMVQKGKSINLPFAFIQVSNGAINVFARGSYQGNFKTARERLPIAKMTTTSIPLMFENEDVMQPTLNLGQFDFSKRVETEMNNLLR